jgi:hypothetical protein
MLARYYLGISECCRKTLFRHSFRQSSMASNTYQWSLKYHLPINACIKLIENEASYRTRVEDDHNIPFDRWLAYLQRTRRKLIKEPESMLSTADIIYFQQSFDNLSFVKDSRFLRSSDNLAPIIVCEDKAVLQSCSVKLFTLCLKQAEKELSKTISFQKLLQASSDLRLPHEWYPYARLMKRKIYFHGGPTNSGKTYHALKRLRDADQAKGGGIFCGPLRLLALEIYEKLNQEGAYASLITGQEKRYVPFASHTACTIEMVLLDKEYDVAVVDEIQMIADPFRGWAW